MSPLSEKQFWREKISVLLHDPITKPFDIKGHEDVAMEIGVVAKVHIDRGEEDKIASAFDRVPLPYEIRGKQIRIAANETYFVHPLTGEKLELNLNEAKQMKYLNELKEKIAKLREQNPDDEKFYHALWWELAELIDIAQVLPADTRVPNHSIIDHLDLSAAVKTAIKGSKVNMALLTFSIGPVQQVIAQARKTIDLWAGSYLLSYLIYKAIEKIGTKYGFDTIIYPYLRNNPFVYTTLDRQGVKLLTKPTIDEKVASLPNIFLALVPYNEAENIIEECKQAVISEWKDLTSKAKEIFEKDTKSEFHGLHNFAEFQKQVELFPTINATFIDLPSNPAEIEHRIDALFNDQAFKTEFEKYNEFLQKIQEKEGYKPNEGSFYKFVYKILMAKMGAIKTVRYFKGYSSDAMLGSQRIPDDFGDGTRACVEVIDKHGEETKQDYLGTLNATKRMLKRILNKSIRYDSTEDIAWNNEVNKSSDKLKNGYIAVLLMDGDKMGKLVSGDRALTIDKVMHEKTLSELPAEIKSDLEKTKMFSPAYQRSISRTLGIFSALVRYIVEDKYEGMLVYAGGDDVLAVLPADKVLKCANDIRKIYSGKKVNYPIKLDGDEYTFDKGFVYKNGKPYANMMGNETMSAGIAIINHKSPLKVALELARSAEHIAKDVYGRNAFAVTVVRRSGQMETVGSKWEIDDMDIIDTAYEITEMAEKVKLSKRSFYKIQDEDFEVLGKENLKELVYYMLRKSDAQNKKSLEFKDLKEKIIPFFEKLYNEQYLKRPIDLLLTIRLTKRGDER